MGTSDGTVKGKVKVVNNGSDDDRWVLVIMGDGFRAADQAKYKQAVTDFVSHMKGTPPFSAHWKSINIYRIDVESDDAGVDNPCGAFGQPAASVDTYFDTKLCSGGIDRALTCDSKLAKQTAKAQVPKYDDLLILANISHWSGAHQSGIPIMALAVSGVKHWKDGALHEGGHAWFGLADEYCTNGTDNYTGSEPGAPNVTKVSTRTGLKWAHHVGATLTTVPNPNCAQCNTAASTKPVGTVGLFEGAKYHHCKLYRPEHDCKMRNSEKPFCTVCKERIVKELKRQKKVVGAIGPEEDDDCFVASAVYADPHHPDVEAIRKWRDHHLSRHSGRAPMARFARLYERVGPPAARFVAPRRNLALGIRRLLLEPLAGWIRRRPWA